MDFGGCYLLTLNCDQAKEIHVAFNGEQIFDTIENEFAYHADEIRIYQASPDLPEWKEIQAYREFKRTVNFEDLWHRIDDYNDPEVWSSISRLIQRLKNREETREFRIPNVRFFYVCLDCQFVTKNEPPFSSNHPCSDDECLCPHSCCCDGLEKIENEHYLDEVQQVEESFEDTQITD